MPGPVYKVSIDDDGTQTENTAPVTPALDTTPPVTPPATPVDTTTPDNTPSATPAVDPVKLEEGITEKVSKTLLEKIGTALGLTKEEKKTLPTDPDELAKFVQDNAKKGTQEVLSEREKAEQDAVQSREKQITEGAQKFQTLWKNQYAELAEMGRVPKIVNPDDKADPGNVAKVKILTKLSQMIKENEANGIDYVPTLKEVFYENPDLLRTDTVAGATVPVSGGGRSIAATGALKYDALNKTPIEDLVAQKYK